MTMSRSLIIRGLGLLAVAAFAGCAHGPLNHVAAGYVTFESAAGEPRGTALLWQDPSDLVHVELQLSGLPPGEHGIHFHAVGKCEGGATAFSTAAAPIHTSLCPPTCSPTRG